MTTQATIAATDAAAAAAFDMLSAARRHEAATFRAWMADQAKDGTSFHTAYTDAIRATNLASDAYNAVREAGFVLRVAVA